MKYLILVTLAGISLCSSLWAYNQTEELTHFRKVANEGYCGKFDHLGNYYWNRCQIRLPTETEFQYNEPEDEIAKIIKAEEKRIQRIKK